MRTVIITSYSADDGSLFDAALRVPDEMELEQQHQAWNRWYREEYCPGILTENYLSFTDWLLKNGAEDANLEVYEH